MLGTYASLLVALLAAGVTGQAIIAACGRRRWSRLAPAVGLAALCPLAWWTVRLPGEGTAAIVAIGLVAAGSAVFLRRRLTGAGEAVRRGVPVELAAVALGSLPFFAAGRFGILGTGLNPDMSQHLFAVDRLASGGSERLISEGYPLGPHSLVAALAELGPSTVHAFDGLMLAVAVATCLAALALLDELGGWRRFGGALAIGFAYLLASYFVQGSFKETMQALFLLAFAIGLLELTRSGGAAAELRARPLLAAVPLAVLAVGSVYVYSFPGLLWLVAALGVWALVELAPMARRGWRNARDSLRAVLAPALAALAVLVLAIAPELGRMADFAGFETFDPAGPGLGNLFNRLSPLEALGIWPSGDFRVEPGDGSVPALVFYLGAAAALAALAYGLGWWWRRGERAVPAALAGAAVLWLYALLAGTPYQEAKALVLLAPLVALISVRAVVAAAPALLAAAFLAAAGGSSLLVLANGPVGPADYSPALAELRPKLGDGSVLVEAPRELLDDQHGLDYLVWELRGNRICVAARDVPGEPPAGFSTVVEVTLDGGAVVPEGVLRNASGPAGAGPCPLIANSARAEPGAAGG